MKALEAIMEVECGKILSPADLANSTICDSVQINGIAICDYAKDPLGTTYTCLFIDPLPIELSNAVAAACGAAIQSEMNCEAAITFGLAGLCKSLE